MNVFDFTVSDLRFYEQYYFKSGSEVSFISKPRVHHGILYLRSCDIDVYLPSGEMIYAKSGDTLYLPSGSKYRSVFARVTDSPPSLLLNFDLRLDSQKYAFSDRVTLITSKDAGRIGEIFEQTREKQDSPFGLKAALYSVLEFWDAFESGDIKRDFLQNTVITPALSLLEQSPYLNVPISVLAEECHMSQSFFRKKFHEIMGVSPKDFCLEKRIEKACALLSSGEVNVSEVSLLLEFSSPSYFSRIFKQKTGFSPIDFIKGKG